MLVSIWREMDPVSATAVESLLVKGALASLTGERGGVYDLALLEALNGLESSQKGRRPSPLALRLCASRWIAMRRCIDALVGAMPAKPWVVLNGADPSPGSLKSSGAQVSVGAGLDGHMIALGRSNRVAGVVEVDIPSVIERKRELIRRAGLLEDSVRLASVDVRDSQALALVVPGRPAIVVAECCLVYVDSQAAASARKALAPKCDAWIEFSPLAPDDAYGEAVLAGFA